MGRPSPLWTRDQVAARILAGESIVIIDNQVIRIPPSWLASHPGGSLAILHFIGRDATDEVHAFHSAETLQRMKGYVVGNIGSEGWLPLVPPIMNGWVRRLGQDGKAEWYNEATAVKSSEDTPSALASEILLIKRDECAPSSPGPSLYTLQPPPTALTPKLQAQHSAAYKELHRRVTEAGLYKTPFLTGYGPEFIRYSLLALFAAFFYSKDWLIASAISLGLCWQQLTFFAHDLGHVGVTHDWVWDRVIAIVVGDLIGGLSIGWWVNVRTGNTYAYDPDIQHLPFFAISPVFFKSLYSSYYKRVMPLDAFAKVLIPFQARLYYIVLSLARFNLYALSYTYLAKTAFEPKRAYGGRWWWWSEIVCLGLFFTWFINVLIGCGTWQRALLYLLVSHIAASPVHVQIVLSHFARSTEDLGVTESFFARQLRTTVDVICSPSIEFIHGGLHLQVTHHLFPRLPRHNLREASLIVKEFSKEQGLEYAEFGFVEGNGDVLGVLKSVSDQMKIMGIVADAEIQEAIGKRHD
ncbi:hypothetical protein FOMPIDRAFT_127777 [Fomitopsis schrenkii]|uniref:Delta 8-(E)-sphingolipid desaturase n=1 Tax=Fomitopsis schrenkii TaxID=2126942 RepID=S8EKL5_FOMSC|nr:hypothetical protein FOMPIDRAFT_127777 [Fomitopsis schrenkii]